MRKRNVTESLANDSNLCRKKSQVYDKSKAKTKDQAICHGEDPLSIFYLINVSSIISIISEGTFENFVKTQEIY